MDPGSAPLDPRLRDSTGAGLRPGPPTTPAQQQKALSASSGTLPHQLPLLQPLPAQQQSPYSHAHPHSHSHSHSHAHVHAHSHGHGHPLAQSPSPPYSHVSSSFTPQNKTLTPIATGASHAPQHQHQSQQSHSQQTPSHQRTGSSGPATPEGGIPGDPNDPKKQRACESCRGLKVRCEPDVANPDGPCKRCAKAGRACVVTQPTRKRQKKTDNRVAELEKKIDALTASLQATRTGVTLPPATAMSPGEPASASGPGSGPPGAIAGPTSAASSVGQKPDEGPAPGSAGSGYGSSPLVVRDWTSQVRDTTRERSASTTSYTTSQRAAAASKTLSSYGTIDINTNTKGYSPPIAGHKRKLGDGRDESRPTLGGPPRPETPEEQPDVVDRNIITLAQADELFTRYTNQMSPHLPCVVFSADMAASELRETKPILFLSIMAAATSEMPHIQKVLTKELMQIFAEKIIIIGQKSLELVQALHVAAIWYWPPEHFEELKFYQLVHVAAVMAIDIGLGRKKQAKGGFRKHIPQTWGDHPLKKNAPPDPTTLEARRTWLSCYFLATNTSMALHRPNLIRWTTFMAECVDVLEGSPEAAPSDKYFCHLIWTHKVAEEVGVLLSMDDPTSTPSISDSRTQYALRGFERELERYSNAIPKEMQQASLLLSFHVLNLYMHEIATHTDFTEDSKQPPAGADPFRDAFPSDTPLTPSHINAISACLTAIDGIFTVFTSLDPDDIRCLPVYNFVRVAYAVVVLIKLYFACASPKSELGKVINKDNMKVEQHLEKLLEKFRATAADDRCRPAAKFLVVLVMLGSWFQKQKQNPSGAPGPPGSSKGSSTSLSSTAAPDTLPTPYQTRQNTGDKSSSTPAPDYSTTANTPLQLLSEVATNDSVATPRPSNPDLLQSANSANNAAWYSNSVPVSRPPPSYMYDTNDNRSASTADPGLPPPTCNLPPASITAPLGPNTQQPAIVMPWLNGAFSSDFDYSSLGDEFAQAMDWSLEDLADGTMRYIMQEPPWFHQMQQMGIVGMGGVGGMDGMGGSAGGAGGGQSGQGGPGMFPF